MTRASRRLTTLVVLVLAAVGLASPSTARSGTAPVTAPDTVTAFAGEYVFADVLADDADAEGDRLRLCGIAPERYPRIRADVDDPREVAVGVGGRARPGTYVFTYYVCDGTSQSAGTLTLVVTETPEIRVRAVRHARDRVRVTSEAPFGVRVSYGDPGGDLEARVYVPKRSSVVFSTRLRVLYWVARTTDGTLLARGHVRRIP